MFSVLVAVLEEVDTLHCCLYFSVSVHHDEVVVLPLVSSPYLRRVKGQLVNGRMLYGVIVWGFPMNEQMSISRVEQMTHIESTVRSYNKEFQADRQSFVA